MSFEQPPVETENQYPCDVVRHIEGVGTITIQLVSAFKANVAIDGRVVEYTKQEGGAVQVDVLDAFQTDAIQIFSTHPRVQRVRMIVDSLLSDAQHGKYIAPTSLGAMLKVADDKLALDAAIRQAAEDRRAGLDPEYE